MKFSVGQLLTTGDFSAPDFFALITKITWQDYYQQNVYTIQYLSGKHKPEQILHEYLVAHLEEMLP
jgi:hypothetical protein